MTAILIKCDPHKAIKGLDSLRPKFIRELLQVTRRSLNLGADILKTRHMSGKSPTSLGMVTGRLRRSVKITPPAITGSKITGAIAVGDLSTPYAKVHISSPRGRETTIVPRVAKMLAIPTKFARTAVRGVPRGRPRDPIWGITFIANNMIFGYKRGTKREYANPVPLFILKKSITVKSRIDLKEDVRKVILPSMRADIKKIVAAAVRGTR